ncbi:hypothetical protein [Pseudoalteromonas arctica]|uniref:DUF1240 domain-containing protein n=1 Tax=Pseudoalteromonas arctica TaxID=394751 RepID=A0A7Y0DVQ1_9GAMM|nr:hypothetical protein [Pseudoalteromonas arctica]NMM42378.1 hypothetical protein [Pseudoalteromonas arctica]
MVKLKKSSLKLQIPTALLFILISFFALGVFGYFTFTLIFSILSESEIIRFDKGAMYMLGVGLTSGLLSFFMVYEILNKKVSASLNKKSIRPALIFLGSIFVVPQLAGLAVDYYVESVGYVYCKEQSSQWLQNQTLIFASNEYSCLKNEK